MEKVPIIMDKGVGDLTFTMTRREIELTLGKADRIDDFIYEEPVYYYDELGLAVCFELHEANFMILSFELEKDCYVLGDFAFFNKNYDEVISYFKSHGISNYQESSYDGTKYIYYDNLSLEFEEEIVDVIALGNPALE